MPSKYRLFISINGEALINIIYRENLMVQSLFFTRRKNNHSYMHARYLIQEKSSTFKEVVRDI